MPNPESQSVSERLIAQLEGEGEYTDEGSFSIDTLKGLDKLAQFQLADSRSYVLRLIEAGLIADADAIHVSVRPDHLEIAFERADPIVLPATVLDRLVTVLVGRVAEHPAIPRAMLVQLAVGVVAALHMSPSRLSIESVNAQGEGRRIWFESATGQHSEAVHGGRPGTRVWVQGLGSQLHERELIEAHCRWVRVPVIVDHRYVSQRALAVDPVVSAVVKFEGQVIGGAAFDSERGTGLLRLLSRGLLIATRHHPDFQPGLVANVEVELRRDLSQAAFADEDKIQAIVEVVKRIQDDELWHPDLPAQLATRLAQRQAKLQPPASDGLVPLILAIIALVLTSIIMNIS